MLIVIIINLKSAELLNSQRARGAAILPCTEFPTEPTVRAILESSLRLNAPRYRPCFLPT